MSGRSTVAPTLELIGKAAPGRMYELGEGAIRIGRDRTSDICLEDRRVSSFHARVLRRPDGAYAVEDLKSYNLTYLDGQPLAPFTPTVLKDGSRIKVCDFTFVFHRQAVEVLEGRGGDPTILGTLEDMSSVSLSSRTDRAATVLRAVLEINRLLGGATELNEVLGRALGELFAIFSQAECGFIITREPDGKLVPRATRHREVPGATLGLSRTVLDHVIRQRRGLILSDVEAGSVALTDSFSGAGIRTALCVPVLARGGEAIGIIQLDSRVEEAVFGPEDLELLAAVAVPIGVVVENHRLLKEKAALAAAAEVQAALLPHLRPAPPGYTFWEHYQPALEVGGDYYDYIPVAPAGSPADARNLRWAVAVGDVSGKGMPAALLVASLSAEVRHLVRSGAGPVETAAAVNRDLYDAGIPGRFVTLLLVTVDARDHRLTVLNAGHLCPIVRRAGGAIEPVGDAETGLPLGIDPETTYRTAATTLGPGDVVVLLTDGVTEAMSRDGAQFGMSGVEGVLAATPGGPAPAGEAILRAVRAHAAGRDQSDDIALIVFGRD
jgi:serine phosphatase RsbU (regulator of sigma subunit)/pSer/pThr/pTyr-binding forkhead associated (FHA) protein